MYLYDLRLLGTLTLLVVFTSFAPCGAQPSDEALVNYDTSPGAYYSVRPNLVLNIAPECRGVIVKLLNRSMTPCLNDLFQEECDAADVDFTDLSLSDAERDSVLQAVEAERALFRGRIEPHDNPDCGDAARFVVSEVWLAAGDNPAAGSYYEVMDNGIRCLLYPCPSYDETKLNSSLWRRIEGVDLTLAGASSQQINQAYEDMTPPNKVLVAGTHTTVSGPAGEGQILVGAQFFTRFRSSPCQPTGCSGQICADTPIATTCEWRPAYACYQTAVCEQQMDGCGWRQTPELIQCLIEAQN